MTRVSLIFMRPSGLHEGLQERIFGSSGADETAETEPVAPLFQSAASGHSVYNRTGR
jgi:hypothetical protein